MPFSQGMPLADIVRNAQLVEFFTISAWCLQRQAIAVGNNQEGLSPAGKQVTS
jgi:hypothetical protein